MFAAALINKLCEDPNTGGPIDENEDDDRSREQSQSYAALSAGVWQALLNVDRRGWEHETKFTAKNNASEEASAERTGIPLADFHAQGDKLQDYRTDPTLLAGDPPNRDSHIDRPVRDESAGGEETLRRSGIVEPPDQTCRQYQATEDVHHPRKRRRVNASTATPQSLAETVRRVGLEYLNAEPGPKHYPWNIPIAHDLEQIIRYGVVEERMLKEALATTQYRLDQMATADRYVDILQISPPNGKRCGQTAMEDEQDKETIWEVFTLVQVHGADKLFPPPYRPHQGLHYTKGPEYLALALMKTDLTHEDIIATVKTLLAEVVEPQLEELKTMVEHEVGPQRRRFHKAYGIASGDVSPV